MKINAIDIKPGNVLEHQNKLWVVLKRDLVQPGKGGSFAQVEMRDLRGGSKLSERFRTQETVERVRLDEKEMQFLYMEGDDATLMDNDSFEQVSVPRELIGDPADFLKDGMVVDMQFHDGAAIGVDLPAHVELRIVETDPGFKGDTATNATKPAKLETGATVNVPLFVDSGDLIRIDTRDRRYIGRSS